jgi:hypothetical protein
LKLIGITTPRIEGLKTPEDIISYCARISNPKNQKSTDTASKLLGYCLENAHWSIFEMVDAVVEIKLARDIGTTGHLDMDRSLFKSLVKDMLRPQILLIVRQDFKTSRTVRTVLS